MSEALTWSHRVTLPIDPRSASGARKFVRAALAGHQLGNLVDDIQLVASELATNAMLHAQTPFSVTLQGIKGSVLLTVRDGSPVLPHEVSAQAFSTSGRGLTIVDHISQEWGSASEPDAAKSVWASFAGSSDQLGAP
jgi:anti-sigma regulatory factor (Ser/Thr protein kinase)